MKRRRVRRPLVGTACTPPAWCVDCRANTTPCTVMRRWGQRACPAHHGWEIYMIADAVWAAADGPARPHGFLCVGCLERRLGRELTAADFKDVSLNTRSVCDSPRLAERKSRNAKER